MQILSLDRFSLFLSPIAPTKRRFAALSFSQAIPTLQLNKYSTTPVVMTGPQIKSDSKYDDFDYPTTSPEVKTGHPGHTTPEQDAQVFQLRTQLEQLNYTERLDTLCLVISSGPIYV